MTEPPPQLREWAEQQRTDGRRGRRRDAVVDQEAVALQPRIHPSQTGRVDRLNVVERVAVTLELREPRREPRPRHRVTGPLRHCAAVVLLRQLHDLQTTLD